jgi:ParB-like chromosome segregation protein Spo0J
MKVETKKVKLLEIKPNPDNPRQINKKQLERLVKSLREFPEMMELREIIVDENMMILGGNMRYRALKGKGEKECIAKIATGLTDEQKREFIIRDNTQQGEWDMDILANVFNDMPLVSWGVGELEGLTGDEETEKLEQKEKEIRPYKKVHVLISLDLESADEAIELLDQLRQIPGVEIEQSAN